MNTKPRIVAIGGTAKPNSSTEQALRCAVRSAEAAGVEVTFFGGEAMVRMPHYLTPGCEDCPEGAALVAAVRAADGVILASPGYHGTISGLVKNALDYLERTARDERVYLDGLPVGLVTTAYGWQAAAHTLGTLRTIAHALRGWPTPLGAAVNSAACRFEDGVCSDPAIAAQLDLVGRQVAEFAARNVALRA